MRTTAVIFFEEGQYQTFRTSERCKYYTTPFVPLLIEPQRDRKGKWMLKRILPMPIRGGGKYCNLGITFPFLTREASLPKFPYILAIN
jgi:hypothetical protein